MDQANLVWPVMHKKPRWIWDKFGSYLDANIHKDWGRIGSDALLDPKTECKNFEQTITNLNYYDAKGFYSRFN